MKNIFHILIIICFSLGCEKGDKSNLNEKIIINIDECVKCQFDSHVIESIDVPIKFEKIIDEPIAIECFEYWNIKNKQFHDNEFYDLLDQLSVYQSQIRPILKENSIRHEKINPNETFMIFNYNGIPYTIDLSFFSNHDGIIMFKPGYKPVLWTIDTKWDYCIAEYFTKCYFEIDKTQLPTQ